MNIYGPNLCGICRKPKSTGDHRKCSRELQRMYAGTHKPKSPEQIAREQRDLERYRETLRVLSR